MELLQTKTKRNSLDKLLQESGNMSLDRIEDALRCPICFQTMPQPVVTQCGHSYCVRCVRMLVTREKESKCPMCQVRCVRATPNYGMIHVLDAFKEQIAEMRRVHFETWSARLSELRRELDEEDAALNEAIPPDTDGSDPELQFFSLLFEHIGEMTHTLDKFKRLFEMYANTRTGIVKNFLASTSNLLDEIGDPNIPSRQAARSEGGDRSNEQSGSRADTQGAQHSTSSVAGLEGDSPQLAGNAVDAAQDRAPFGRRRITVVPFSRGSTRTGFRVSADSHSTRRSSRALLTAEEVEHSTGTNGTSDLVTTSVAFAGHASSSTPTIPERDVSSDIATYPQRGVGRSDPATSTGRGVRRRRATSSGSRRATRYRDGALQSSSQSLAGADGVPALEMVSASNTIRRISAETGVQPYDPTTVTETSAPAAGVVRASMNPGTRINTRRSQAQVSTSPGIQSSATVHGAPEPVRVNVRVAGRRASARLSAAANAGSFGRQH